MHECSTCHYSLMKVAVCYQNVGEQLSILASVYESFIMTVLLCYHAYTSSVRCCFKMILSTWYYDILVYKSMVELELAYYKVDLPTRSMSYNIMHNVCKCFRALANQYWRRVLWALVMRLTHKFCCILVCMTSYTGVTCTIIYAQLVHGIPLYIYSASTN